MALFQVVKRGYFASHCRKKIETSTFPTLESILNPKHQSVFAFYFAFPIQSWDVTNDYGLENLSETVWSRYDKALIWRLQNGDSCNVVFFSFSLPSPTFVSFPLKTKDSKNKININNNPKRSRGDS